jgi:hypothetical protein
MKPRIERLLPNGLPKYVRCYDNGGETFDRYTVVFTGHFKKDYRGQCFYLGMSTYPFHPQGFGQHGEADKMIDRPAYGHLGKKMAFATLPPDVQRCVLQTYREVWGLNKGE